MLSFIRAKKDFDHHPPPPSPESKYQAAATFFGAGRPGMWGAATFPSQPQLAAAKTKTCGGSDFDCAQTQKIY
jgi:hypothetical protein